MKSKNNLGQVSLVVLLVASVVTTLGLSLSKKTVLETKIDIDEELKKQSFNSAESGIEHYLGTGAKEYQSADGKTRVKIAVEPLGNSTKIDYSEIILPGGYQYFWLVAHDDLGEIDYANFYSGDRVAVCVAGYAGKVAVDYYYREGGVFKVDRKMLDFGGGANCGNVSLVTGGGVVPLLLTASPVGTQSINISLEGLVTFPAQGKELTAVGEAGDLTGNTVKSRVKTLDRYKVLPILLEPLSARGEIGY